MKKLFCILVMLLSVGLIVSCDNDNSEIIVEEAIPEKLVVYTVGDHFLTNYGEEFFSTQFQLGEFQSMAERWGESGYIYYDAIKEFEEKTGIDVEITFFIGTEFLLEAVAKEVKEGGGPDIILGNYTCGEYNLYPYFQENIFADMRPYFDEDELYSSGKYVSNVLKAGLVGDKQYLFPLLFNMNMLYSSNESMNRHDLKITRDMKYDEILDSFVDSWKQIDRDRDEHLLLQYTNMWNDYPYILFQAASGEQIIDYETGRISLDEEYFCDLLELYESYLCNDYNMSREELKALAAANNGYLSDDESKYYSTSYQNMTNGPQLDIFNLVSEDVAFWAEGGNTSYHLHSFASQAYYYESRITDSDEEFVCVGIPSRNQEAGYTAQVTMFGAVTSNTQYPQYCYDFLKSIADYEIWQFMGLPVNNENARSMIDEMSNTYYSFYPNLGTFPPEREPEGADWLGDSYLIKPMTNDTKEYLFEMISHIAVAKLPEFALNRIITKEIEEYIYGETESRQEAYNKALQQLKMQAINN